MTHGAGDASRARVIRWPSGESRTFAPQLKGLVEQSVREGEARFTLDMSGVSPSDVCTDVLGYLLWAWKAAKEGGGDIRIFSSPRHVTELIETLGLDERFPNYANEEDALSSFEK